MKTKLLKKLRKRFYWFYDGDRWVCYDRAKNIEKRFLYSEFSESVFKYIMDRSKYKRHYTSSSYRKLCRKKLFLKRKYAKHFK